MSRRTNFGFFWSTRQRFSWRLNIRNMYLSTNSFLGIFGNSSHEPLSNVNAICSMAKSFRSKLRVLKLPVDHEIYLWSFSFSCNVLDQIRHAGWHNGIASLLKIANARERTILEVTAGEVSELALELEVHESELEDNYLDESDVTLFSFYFVFHM